MAFISVLVGNTVLSVLGIVRMQKLKLSSAYKALLRVSCLCFLFPCFHRNSRQSGFPNSGSIECCRMSEVYLLGIFLLDLFLLMRKTHILLHVQNLGLLSRRCIFFEFVPSFYYIWYFTHYFSLFSFIHFTGTGDRSC